MSDPVAELLAKAHVDRASDVHLEPLAEGYCLRQRVDGVLSPGVSVSAEVGRMLVGRLMVGAGLLTYKPHVPQEGRLPLAAGEGRLAVMPTVHGLRAVVRLPAAAPLLLAELGLNQASLTALQDFVRADAGLLAVCGPAGSGKTTVAYALMRAMVAATPLSAVSVEDPVERHIPGVAQIEVQPFGDLTFARALRSVLRQDPQVILVGEIRDAESAAIAVQAALGGHRVVTTVHASDGPGAVVRLLEMGLAPYQLASALHGVLALRLLRRRVGSAYAGRVPASEWMGMTPAVRTALLAKSDDVGLRQAARLGGLREAAEVLAAAGLTDDAEIDRIFGPKT